LLKHPDYSKLCKQSDKLEMKVSLCPHYVLIAMDLPANYLY
jgi:hypothetical protein